MNKKSAVLPFTTAYETLGIEVQNAVALFKIKHADHREAKKSDWPAYKTSKLKSIKEFERLYKRLTISAVNETNILFTIEGEYEADMD